MGNSNHYRGSSDPEHLDLGFLLSINHQEEAQMHNKPCIVQRDRTVLLETCHADYEAARDALAGYADLIKSPSSFHTYRITPLSLWNAAAAGMSPAEVATSLQSLSRFDVPATVLDDIRQLMGRYGQLSLLPHPTRERWLVLYSDHETLIQELKSRHAVALGSLGMEFISLQAAQVPAERRGEIKQELTRLGYPVLDRAGYQDGQYLDMHWRENESFQLRDYQRSAVESFKDVDGEGGNGVLVLPCGAGKTIIGLAAMLELKCETLILTSNTTSVRQWSRELQSRTSLTSDDIGEYSGQRKMVRPVTVATYQILTHRKGKDDEQLHMKLFNERRWGLIIYDEVHLLPAPVFRATADIQATRRLGLTATLVREDGREHDVFSLIGPKRYEMPWKRLEETGWIAEVACAEIKVPLPEQVKNASIAASKREQYRLAAENPLKLDAACRLIQHHHEAQTLIIGQYLDQLHLIAERLQAPLITGQTTQEQRQELYAAFRRGDVRRLVVSKVANFAVDLPDASVAIELSGSYAPARKKPSDSGVSSVLSRGIIEPFSTLWYPRTAGRRCLPFEDNYF